MSSTDEHQVLKGGHPPAVKAGGMRITRANAPDLEAKASPPKDDKAAIPEGVLSKSDRHNQQLLISGAVTKGDCDFSPEAIKQYHDKPTPTREKHYGEAKGHGNAVSRHGQARGIFIHQPK